MINSKCVLLAVFLASLILFGCTSGRYIKFNDNSMAPALKSGQIVKMEIINGSQANVGDIVVFEMSRGTIVHRIIWIDKEKGIFTAKGDANRASMVEEANISINLIQGRISLK